MKYVQHLPLVLISAFSIKFIILGCNFSDASCFAALCAMRIVTHYVEHNKAKIIERDQLQDAQKLREEVAAEMILFKQQVIDEVARAKLAAGIQTRR